MKSFPMIVAIVVSIFSAQGVLSQSDLALLHEEGYDNGEFEYEQNQYTEINTLEVPFLVKESVKADYERCRLIKAFLSKDHTYKMILQHKDNTTKVVFSSANGKWIMPNDHKS